MTYTYKDVNAAWPTPYPVPTAQEAITGVKQLLRVAHRLVIEDGAIPKFVKRRKWRGFKTTTGNRHTWPNGGVFYVNPNWRGMYGWHGIVHNVSHWIGHHYWPKEGAHSPRHVWIEAELADYAIKNLIGGQLRRPEKPKADPITKRAERVAARLKKWQTRKRRAENAIRKLRRQERYYGKRHARHTGVSAQARTDTGGHEEAQA